MMELKSQAVLWVLLFGLAGCNDSGSASNSNSDVAPSTADAITENDVDLSSVSLNQNRAQPLSRLALQGVPESLNPEDLYIEYRMARDSQVPGPGVNDSGFAAIMRPVEQLTGFWLVVPLADPDGADLVLRLTDGASYSATLDLQVDALPEANPDITLDSVLDEVEALLQTVTKAYGLTYPDDLQAMIDTPASVRVEYLPLIRAYHAIGNPDNPEGLRQQAFDTETLSVLNRMLAHWQPEKVIQQRTNFVRQNSDLIEEVVPYLDVSAGTTPDLRSGSSAPLIGRNLEPDTRSTTPNPIEDYMLPAPIDIDSPGELEYWMGRYGDMYRLQSDIQLAIDATEHVVMVIGTAAIIASGPAGIQAASGVVAMSKAADTAVSIAGYTNEAFRMVRAFAPCCIIDIELELSPASGVVNQEDAASPALLLQKVNAFATSDAIDLAGELMSIAIDETAGKVSGKLSERFENSDLAELAISDTLGSVYEGYEFAGKKTYFSWTVNLTDSDPERWVEVELDGLANGPIVFKQLETQFNQFRFDLDETVFFGQEQYPTVLRAGPKTDAFDFGPWHPAIPGGSSEISAKTIQLTTSPNVIRIEEPGEQIEFTVTVKNAVDFSLDDSELYDLDPSYGSVGGVLSGQTTGIYKYRYTAPEEELPENFFVTLFAESREGVRGRTANPTERFTTLAFTADQPRLLIEPGGSCLEVGSQQTFTAIDPDNGEPLPADWSVSGTANLVSDGVVEAVGEGTVTVTATHPDDPDRTDHVQFIAGDCTCWWSGRVGGDFGHRMTNELLSIDFDDNGALTDLDFYIPTGYMNFTADPPIPAGVTGTFTLSENRGGDSNSTGRAMAWVNPAPLEPAQSGLPPISNLELTLTRHEMLDQGEFADLVAPGTRRLTGTVTGIVVNDYVAYEPTRYERLQGILDVHFQGDFWVDLNDTRLNCSRGLGL